MKVFITGPLFNPKEREENLEIDEVLKSSGHETFLPQRDGFLLQDITQELKNSVDVEDAERMAVEIIFLFDAYNASENCDAVVFNLNGRVPDEGGLIEAALAVSGGKKVVFYKNDSRSLILGRDNPMIGGLVDFKIVKNIEEIPSALSSTENNFKEEIKKAKEIFGEYEKEKTIKNLVRLAKEYL